LHEFLENIPPQEWKEEQKILKDNKIEEMKKQ
jgi:hypothetical protein